MTKLPIQNQGFRLDLNLSESFDDDSAWNNLYNPGIADDIAILVNNLRNTSKLGATSGVSISLTTDEINDANYGVNNVTTIAPHFFTFNKTSNGDETDSVFTNDDVIRFSETITFNVGKLSNSSGTIGDLDQLEVSPNQNYYVCESNARNKFKISTTHSTSITGINTVQIISVSENSNHESTPHVHGTFPSTFEFIRNDGVLAPNLRSFIKPEILDDNFTYLPSSGINASFSFNLNIYEYSEIVTERKYKTNESIISNDRDFKYEGSVRVEDPDNWNNSIERMRLKNDDGTPDTPGIFIGDTRAFSTDNNPWSKSDNLNDTLKFSTKSHADEFTIGDLEFGGVINDSGDITDGKIKINGLSAEIVDITDSDSKFSTFFQPTVPNVFKFPMIINGETFYILVQKE